MNDKFIFGNSVNIWHPNENEKVRIGIGTCNNLLVIPIYGPCGVGNCIVVLIEIENCEHRKLFYLIPSVRYYGLVVGIKVCWPCKYLSMNDEKAVMTKNQCHMITNGVNNLLKKRILCKDNSLAENFQVKNIHDVENMGNIVGDLRHEEVRGEMIYIFEDGVEMLVGEFGFDSMSEKEMKRIL
jgi:hypothetical protein